MDVFLGSNNPMMYKPKSLVPSDTQESKIATTTVAKMALTIYLTSYMRALETHVMGIAVTMGRF